MGYIEFSRSERSQLAIINYEVPMNHINRELLKKFIHNHRQYDRLSNLPVSLWKFTARSIGKTSWHHTSLYYNQTAHYSIEAIAEDLLENLEARQKDYANSIRKKTE